MTQRRRAIWIASKNNVCSLSIKISDVNSFDMVKKLSFFLMTYLQILGLCSIIGAYGWYRTNRLISSVLRVKSTLLSDIHVPIENELVARSKSLSISRNIASNGNSDISFWRQNDAPTGKQPLLYLAGIDGHGNFTHLSLSNLTQSYDVWRLYVGPKDRSSFLEIASQVTQFVSSSFTEPVVLVGESFGGLLASYIATQQKIKLSNLVLINPATSYDRTIWQTLGPLVTSTGRAFPLVGMTALMLTALQPSQVQRVGRSVLDRIKSVKNAKDELDQLFESSKMITESIPATTLRWRLSEWLSVGCYLMSGQYRSITAPTLILSGINDRLLPSFEEGRRLQREMKNCSVELLEFQDSSHAFLDGSVDLAKVFRESKTLRQPQRDVKVYEPTSLDVSFPSQQDLQDLDRRLGPFFRSFSPVFFSRGMDGKLLEGLAGVPSSRDGRPVLLVGNHQLLGADLGLLVRRFVDEKKVLPRGLAHPLIFQDPVPYRKTLDWKGDRIVTGRAGETVRAADDSMTDGEATAGSSRAGAADGTAMYDLFKRFGAVEVSPMSLFRLLQRNETVLLFPGGASEALNGRTFSESGEDLRYKLFWPQKTDFIRMAAMLDAIVVPFAAVGMADSARIVIDSDALMKLPIIGRNMRESSKSMPQARAGVDELFTPPVVAPLLPSRNYFLFEQPYDTRELNASNKTACKEAYAEVRSRVENGIKKLQAFREADQYKDFIPRAFYETTRGVTAPTSPMSML